MASKKMGRLDLSFLLSKAPGELSVNVGTLKQRTEIYAPGTVVIAEYVADAATGLFVDVDTLTDAALADYETIIVAIVGYETDAREGNTPASLFDKQIEFKPSQTSLPDLSVAAKAIINTALSAQTIVAR